MSAPPIAFALHLAEIMNHYLPIMLHLGKEAVILNCAQTAGGPEERAIEARAEQAGFAHLKLHDVLKEGTHFDVLISNQPFVVPWNGTGDASMLPLARQHIRLTYALGKSEWNFANWNHFYDKILCYGPYQQRLFERRFPNTKTVPIGIPRFDRFFAKDTTTKKLYESYAADLKKPNLVWLPTHGVLSSIDDFAEPIAALTLDYNVWVKLHPATSMQEGARVQRLRNFPFTALIEDATDNASLFRLADYVLADYGGSAFGALYTDKNLLLLNSGADIFADDTGWLSADIQLRDAFANLHVGEADQIATLLKDSGVWQAQSAVRARYRDALFEDTKGCAGLRAAQEILASQTSPKRARSIYTPVPLSDEDLSIFSLSKDANVQHRSWRARIAWERSSRTELRSARDQAEEEKTRAIRALDLTKDTLAQTVKLQQEAALQNESLLQELIAVKNSLAKIEQLQDQTSQQKEAALADLNEAMAALARAENDHTAIAERYKKFEIALAELEKNAAQRSIVNIIKRLVRRFPYFAKRRELTAEPITPQLLIKPVKPKSRPFFSAEYGVELAQNLTGKRIVMICDDLQIDRRILQEAHSLAPFGAEIIVVGRAGVGYPPSETDGSVKIERLDYEAMYTRRLATQRSSEFSTDSPSGISTSAASPSIISTKEAARHLLQKLRSNGWVGPRLENFITRQRRPVRVALRILIWPPYRLEILRRLFPRLRLRWLALLYLPTLLLTPRPKAIIHHWRRVRPLLFARLGIKTTKVAEVAPIAELQQHQNMNLWEQAVYEHLRFLRPDVIHVHDLPQLRPSVFAGEELGSRVIYDAHELYPTIHTLSQDQQVALRLTEAAFMPRTHRTITVNPFFAAHQVISYGVPEPEVILNATTLPEGFVRGKKLRLFHDMLQLPPEHKVILFQGWLSFDRRIGDIIDAMIDVPPNIHLVLMGYGNDIPSLKKQARAKGVTSRVHFVSPVPQADLMHYVASSDAGIVPYQPVDDCHRYCSPNKMFEFIAAGVPLIANDLPYLRSIIEVNAFGVVERLVLPSDYARAIRRMFTSDDGDETRFHDRLLNSSDPFLWPAQEQVLLHIYREVLCDFKALPRPSGLYPFIPPPNPMSLRAPAQDATLRVFHGPGNAAGIPSIMAKAERALGLDSKAICYPNGNFQYPADELLEITQDPTALQKRFEKYADAFDVFVFHFGQSLAHDTLADVPLLKQMGKTVIFYFHGCDIRQSKETIGKYEFSACKACWPQRCSRNRDHALEIATHYADAIWVSTPDLLEFVPKSELFLQPILLEDFPFYQRQFRKGNVDDHLRVVHAPSDRQLKGTAYLERAVQELHSEGVPLDLVLLHGLTHAELRRKLNDADFGVDQLLFGSYGMLAVEQMALGLPVMCYLRDDVLAQYPEAPPIWRTTASTLTETLRAAMEDPLRLSKMATEGRAYVERYHGAEVAAQRAVSTYRRVRNQAALTT